MQDTHAIAASDPVPEATVTSHLGFVVSIAAEYRHRGVPFEDLCHEGNLGLLIAARRYDPKRGAKFTSYAVHWIRKTIRAAIDWHSTILHVPQHQLRRARYLAFEESRPRATRGIVRYPTKVARDVGLSVSTERALRAVLNAPVSLDAPRPSGDGTRADSILDTTAEDPEESLLFKDTMDRIRRAVERLEETPRRVIQRGFGIPDGESATLREVALALGVSRERVRQVEAQALSLLKKRLGMKSFPLRSHFAHYRSSA
jgi:RNA polymerase sigma factor (sigma-70 family)